MTYWKELIDIPEGSVERTRFVVDLRRGLDQPDELLDSYVVTPDLAKCFDEALGHVRGAMKSGDARAVLLHGSFGSGKSHFMAVLHQLLSGSHKARGLDGLDGVVERHAWLAEQRRYLLVPAYFVGARTMEQRLYRDYIEHLGRIEPDASTPGVFIADDLFDDADKLRERLGDEEFFDALGDGGGSADDGWGDLAAGWDAERYDRARSAPVGTADRQELVGALVDAFFPTATKLLSAAGGEQTAEREAVVELTQGLPILARHAKSLGYDGLILLLDELILWLMQNAGEPELVQREAAKIVQFVEGMSERLAVPIVSFVAQQRKLEEFVGDALTGEGGERLSEILGHMGDRFETIELQDTDLPVIAHHRLLEAKGAEARARIDESFRQVVDRMPPATRDVLLSAAGRKDLFRLSYPFSPALIQALIALSTMLQRDRTALRLLTQLLTDKRDTLELGHVVPMGELWDIVERGGEPFSKDLKARYDRAVALWRDRLRPMLAEQHGVDPAQARPSEGGTERAAWADGLLLKTLLLAGLLQSTDEFRELTPDKLVALNYGVTRSVIPGNEPHEVLAKMRRWNEREAAIRVEPGDRPRLGIDLSSVDVEELLQHIDPSVDNERVRVETVRGLVFEEAGVKYEDTLLHTYSVAWRGERRSIDVLFENVRQLGDDQIRGGGAELRVLIDYPFDDTGHSPADDQAHLDEFRKQQREEIPTVAWLPCFLTEDGKRLLGRFVRLEHYARRPETVLERLPAAVREQARDRLNAAHGDARRALVDALRRAYHLTSDENRNVDTESNEHDPVLWMLGETKGSAPGATKFDDGLEELVRAGLRRRYPESFMIPDAPLSTGRAQAMADVLSRAFADGEVSVPVDVRRLRGDLLDYAKPIDLIDMEAGKNRFQPKTSWKRTIDRALSERGDKEPSVAALRVIVAGEGRDANGLPRWLIDVIVICYAAMTNRTFVLDGQPQDAKVKALDDRAKMVEARLPTEKAWETVTGWASAIFGLADPPRRNARGVERLVEALRAAAEPERDDAENLPRLLLERRTVLGLSQADVEGSARYRMAVDVWCILNALTDDEEADPADVIEAVAQCTVQTPEGAGVSLKTSGAVTRALTPPPGTETLYTALARFANDEHLARAHDAEELLEAARRVYLDKEQVSKMATLRQLNERAIAVMFESTPTQERSRADSGQSVSHGASTPPEAVAPRTEEQPSASSAGHEGSDGMRSDVHRVASDGELDRLVATLRARLSAGEVLTIRVEGGDQEPA